VCTTLVTLEKNKIISLCKVKEYFIMWCRDVQSNIVIDQIRHVRSRREDPFQYTTVSVVAAHSSEQHGSSAISSRARVSQRRAKHRRAPSSRLVKEAAKVAIAGNEVSSSESGRLLRAAGRQSAPAAGGHTSRGHDTVYTYRGLFMWRQKTH
jgi:hypothetical protein